MADQQTAAGPAAPTGRLATIQLALSGTAFFLRQLDRLPDDRIQEASLIPEWSRAMVAADVGYRARALGRLLNGDDDYPNAEYRLKEVVYGASLAPRALRHLVAHSAMQLRVLIRDLPPERWDSPRETVSGERLTNRDIPWLRARNVWLHAVNLRAGASYSDLPVVLRELIGPAAGCHGRGFQQAPGHPTG